MTLEQDVALLRRLPIFASFSDEQLRLVAFSAEPLDLPPGTVLFREGAAAEGGFVVVSGRVRLFAAGEDGPVEKGSAESGALIGEMALLCVTDRPTNAETVDQCALLSISRRLLWRMFQEYPEMAERVRQTLSARLSDFTRDLMLSRVAQLGDNREA